MALTRIAFIPARGGSKRIPNKNIRNFAGSPMISWPILACLEADIFESVIVSTDSPEIAELSSSYGADVIIRSSELSDDHAGTTEVLKDFLSHQKTTMAEDPWIYKIYPTSYMSAKTIKAFSEATEASSNPFTLSVGKSWQTVQRSLAINPHGGLEMLFPEHASSRSQDLVNTFFDAGKLYGGRRSAWLKTQSPLLDVPTPFVLPFWESVDLDTLEDWKVAEAFVRMRSEGVLDDMGS